jgi:uncharacterized protein YndB with AHSA1/START domain
MSAPADGYTLHLERLLPATPAVVFRAHTDPELLARWWGPDGFSIPSVDIDLRVRGRYRIAMQPPDGDVFHLRGEFRDIAPPERLAYTFEWEEPDPDDRENLVTFSVRDLGGSAALTVDQGPFATEARRALHDSGWSDGLRKLEELVTAIAPGAS